METNKIPLEALVKYLNEENKKLQGKLDTLVPYTKRLEKELESHKDAEIRLTNELESTKKEMKRLRSDYKLTDWYQQLKKQNADYRQRHKTDNQTINRLLVQIMELKKQKNPTLLDYLTKPFKKKSSQ